MSTNMTSAKGCILAIGLVVGFLGYECLPHGQSADPENNLSVFAQSADVGAYKSFGFVMMVVGGIIVIVGLIVPSKD